MAAARSERGANPFYYPQHVISLSRFTVKPSPTIIDQQPLIPHPWQLQCHPGWRAAWVATAPPTVRLCSVSQRQSKTHHSTRRYSLRYLIFSWSGRARGTRHRVDRSQLVLLHPVNGTRLRHGGCPKLRKRSPDAPANRPSPIKLAFAGQRLKIFLATIQPSSLPHKWLANKYYQPIAD